MYLIVKRVFDIIFSLLSIIVLLPIFVPIIILLKFTGEGEILYLQERIGFRNKKFKIIKFATMLKASPSLGTGMITLRNDYRVTNVGRFLRMSKINELPQIFNILIGDISFVGPRPLVEKIFNNYSKEIQKIVYNAKPGLTGMGSIVFRDEEKLFNNVGEENYNDFYKNEISPYKGKLELWYQNNQSFLIDFIIILLTAVAVILPKLNLHNKIFKTLPKK